MTPPATLAREVSRGVGTDRWPSARIVACSLAAVAAVPAVPAAMGRVGFGWSELAGVFMAQLALLLFLLPGLGALVMRAERQAREARLFLLPPPERARPVWAVFWVPVAVTAGLCVTCGLAAGVMRALVGGVPVSAIAHASAALMPGAVCALALGGYCSLVCRDACSGAGLALCLSAAVSLAPVWLGPAIADIPGGAALVQPTLAGNPFVGLASAIDFDLFRTEPLYWMSPVAQRKFDYPSAWTVSLVLGLASALLFWRSAVRLRRMAEPSD